MTDYRYEAFKLSLGSSTRTSSALHMASLESLPLSYASCSLGCKPEHTILRRIEAIAAAGFTGIEISMPDLVSLANNKDIDLPNRTEGQQVSNKDYEQLRAVAAIVRDHMQKHGLEAMLMQPFANFEGWPKGSPERKEAWERVEGWISIMEVLPCKTLQVGSTDMPAEKINTSRDDIVEDLQQLADRLAEKNMRVAYENWCWSTHAPDWIDVCDICHKVDRANFGLCLDTFQSAGGEWADPSTSSGLVEDGRSKEQVEKDWKASCQKLSETVPAEKIYLLQISDAYKPREPFSPEADADGMRPRARWSSAWRPLPFEGYLPTVDFASAVLKTGFRGWFSYEIFDGGPDGSGREHDLNEWTKSARTCQERLIKECSKM